MGEPIRTLIGVALGILTLAGFYYWVFVWVPPEYEDYLEKKRREPAEEKA